MTFETAHEANRFLVAQVLEEANRSGVVLTPVDEHELRTPDCGHTFEEDEALDAQLPAGYSHWTLRAKAARLLHRAYYADRTDPGTRDAFRAAYRAMRKSPYILTNLTHGDSPILNAIERFHAGGAFESATMTLAMLSPMSLVPPHAVRRPLVIVVGMMAVMCGLGLAAVILLWR